MSSETKYRTVRVRIKPLTKPLPKTDCKRFTEHVSRVRAQRVAHHEAVQAIKQVQQAKADFGGWTKVCRGFNRDPHELPLMAEYFHYRKRKGSRRVGCWNPLCRACNTAKRNAQRAARVQP
jgi:hypothetical protein